MTKRGKCHICGSTNAHGRDWRPRQGGKPLCRTCAEAIGRDPRYGLRKKQ